MLEPTVTGRIFDVIESKFFTNRKQLIDSVSEVLHLQPSSIYKKAKGESSLSLDETEKLCRHFRISLDEVFGLSEDRIYFDFPALYGAVKDHMDFIGPIRQDMESLRLVDAVIYYATKELPVFYYFLFPRLLGFKFFVFSNFIWRQEDQPVAKYDEDKYLQDEAFVKAARRILDIFSEMQSVEIWHSGVLDNTFNQIRYMLEAEILTERRHAMGILSDIDQLIDIFEDLVRTGDKSSFHRNASAPAGTFRLYKNEILHTNNLIYVRSETHEAVYNTYDNPNFMRSISPLLCSFTWRWFNRIIHNSVPITGGSLKDQHAFISRLREKSAHCRTFINYHFDSASA